MITACSWVSLQHVAEDRAITHSLSCPLPCVPTAQSVLLPVQKQLVCAQVQLADLLMVLLAKAHVEKHAERDRWLGLNSVEKVCQDCGYSEF